jgi:hypothetical protein
LLAGSAHAYSAVWVPPEYDHPYHGKVEIVQYSTLTELRQACKVDDNSVAGCMVSEDGHVCVIARASDRTLAFNKWTQADIAALIRQETARCNGFREPVSRPAVTYGNTTTLYDEKGGGIYEHRARWQALAHSGNQVEIRGRCQSACTLITAYIPRERLCFGERGFLAFHSARTDDGVALPDATRDMFNTYPQEIRDWILARGGPEKMTSQYWILSPSELWAMGYRRCDAVADVPLPRPRPVTDVSGPVASSQSENRQAAIPPHYERLPDFVCLPLRLLTLGTVGCMF